MKTKTALLTAGALLALSLISGTSAIAETHGTEDPMAEAQAFLASPTSLSQAIIAAEESAGGKVSSIEYESGEDGMPDLIMADVVLADGTEMTVAINPADGKVLSVTLGEDDQQGDDEDDEEGDGEQDDEEGSEGGDGEEEGENASN